MGLFVTNGGSNMWVAKAYSDPFADTFVYVVQKALGINDRFSILLRNGIGNMFDFSKRGKQLFYICLTTKLI